MTTFVKRLLRPLGVTVIRLKNLPQETDDVHQVCRRLGIDLVLDVGANQGQFGVELRSAGYRGRIVSFEPIAETFGLLKEAAQGDRLWECRQCAVGEAVQTLPMNVSGFSPSSSLLPMADRHLEVKPDSGTARVETVAVTSLDAIAGELGLSQHKTLLKIDVQGYESAVLRGALQSLPLIAAVQVEIFFAEFYHEQSRYFEIMQTLEQAGLRLVGLHTVAKEKTTGYWMWCDGLFVRNRA